MLIASLFSATVLFQGSVRRFLAGRLPSASQGSTIKITPLSPLLFLTLVLAFYFPSAPVTANTMTSKLIPSNPEKVMVIRDVVPKTITTLSVPFARFGRIKVGGRGTIGKVMVLRSTSPAY